MHAPNTSTRPVWRSSILATLILLAVVFGLVMTPPTTFGATSSITFAVVGDYGSGNSNEAAVANMVKSWSPSFVITTGDDYYTSAGGSGSTKYDMSTGKYYCQYLAGITTAGTNCPQPGGSSVNHFYPSLGNEDYSQAGSVNGVPNLYLDYFNLPGPGVTSPNPTGNERYYDFVQGPVHFFVINSNNGSGQEPDGVSATSKQALWLKSALAASTSTWNVVYFHAPPYSSGTKHGSSTYMRWPFDQWGADAVLSGHDHEYERLIENGIPYFVNGAGGYARYTCGTPIAGSQFCYDGNWGAQRVTASDTTLSFQFISVDGVTRDTYTLTKAPGSPTSTSTKAPTPPSTATRTNTPLPTNTPTNTPTKTPTAVGTATNTPTSGGSFQPLPPIRAAFFYPWFPTAWTQGGVYPFTNYTPTMGYYSSTDNAIIDQQLSLAATAHLNAFISSWWGQGDRSDTALQYILGRSARVGSPNPNLRWAIYYEGESQGDPTSAQIVSDLQYLQSKVFSSPAYLRVNGKPVVFVYADAADASGMAQRWAQAKRDFGGNVYLVLKVYAGYASDPNQPDSWHQYAPAVGYDGQGSYSATVSPGFWLKGQAVRLTRDPVRFESDVKKMVASNATWQLVTTWSEWGEGTIVEPAAEFGNTYIDILCRNLPGTAPCPGSSTPTPTATNTPAPTPTNTPSPTPTSTPTAGPSLAWYPSIQQLLATSAHVVWTTNGTGAPTVRYSTDLSLSQVASGTSKPLGDLGTTQHRVSLTGLSPNTTYNYKVYVGGVDLTPGRTFSFKTGVSRGAADAFTAIAFGDYGYGTADQIGLRNQMAKDKFDFILTTGDNDQDVGTYQDYDAHVFDVYTDLLSRVGLYPTVGNHDYLTNSAGPYQDIFDLPNGSTNYSFDYGQVHFVSIDEEAPLSSGVTAAWLDQDLASTTQPVKVVALHQPAYSTGTVNPVDTRVQTQIIPILEKYKVDLVLQGHNHIYERSKPINGVTYVEVSTGAKVSQPCTDATWVAFKICSPTASLTSIYARLQVVGTTITLDAVDQNGAVLDHVVLSKSAPTPTPTPTQVTTKTITLAPTADSYVDSANPSTNYGTSTQIRVDGSPTVRSYLTFNVQGVSGTVSKATLRIYVNSASSNGVSVRGLASASSTWSETTINYSNAPAISSTITATSPGVTGGTWITLDVTSLVTGNGTKQMVLTTAGSTAISLASRHSGATSPQLIVEYK